MRCLPARLLLLLALGSCASAPKPPGVDESRKRPANAATAVELQSCRSELQNTRIVANESQRAAAGAAASAAQVAEAIKSSSTRNAIYMVLFPYGSTKAQITDAELARVLQDARTAPLVVLRGRTDGVTASLVEGRVARQRAESVQALLVQAGVDPARIRMTSQAAGDHAADNELEGGRALNRRVEVEIYRMAPQAPVTLVSAASPHGGQRSVPPITSEVQHGQQFR